MIDTIFTSMIVVMPCTILHFTFWFFPWSFIICMPMLRRTSRYSSRLAIIISVFVKSSILIVFIAFWTIASLNWEPISLQQGGNISVTTCLNLASSNIFEQSSTIIAIVWIEFSTISRLRLFSAWLSVKQSLCKFKVKNYKRSGHMLNPPRRIIRAITLLTVFAILGSVIWKTEVSYCFM